MLSVYLEGRNLINFFFLQQYIDKESLSIKQVCLFIINVTKSLACHFIA